MDGTLDELDRRVVGALQVDGRATWQRIAQALEEPESLVAHRGRRLLDAGIVRVVGVASPDPGTVVRMRCSPGQERVTALALARRRDTRYVHLLAGPFGGVVEIGCTTQRLARLVGDELPRLGGLVESDTATVLRRVRGAHEWQPGILGAAEREVLTDHLPPPEYAPFGELKDIGRADQMLLTALQVDARRDVDEVAGVTGLSRTAVTRRLERLRRDGRLRIRVVVDPALLGFGVRALVWARAAPRDVDAVAEALVREPWVVHASCVSGDRPVLAEVAVPGVDALHDLTTVAPWLARVTALESSMIVGTLKDGGLFSL